METRQPLIGILGGMGPQAGLDLSSKIIAETNAVNDQDHLPVVLFSMPEHVPNRTDFLLGKITLNPAVELSRQLALMSDLGVTVVGMACNTAHGAPIFDELVKCQKTVAPDIRLLNMIDETLMFIREHCPDVSRVGILATTGTYQFRLYDDRIESAGLIPVLPDESIAEGSLQSAISDPKWGIKSNSSPVTSQARSTVLEAIENLRERGAQAVILGCTELPLAIEMDSLQDPVIIDPTRILARALISHAYPQKLRP
ncbi:MAG: aspartate racemase [Rhodothermia bacterium]|nr:MAG: aspartate racemase [Rhodothermia bacterium]